MIAAHAERTLKISRDTVLALTSVDAGCGSCVVESVYSHEQLCIVACRIDSCTLMHLQRCLQLPVKNCRLVDPSMPSTESAILSN